MRQSTIATIIFMAAMNTALASEGAAEVADGRNAPGSPCNRIQHFPGGYRSQTFIRDDGTYDLVVANQNQGTVEQYVLDPKTGMVTAGPMISIELAIV